MLCRRSIFNGHIGIVFDIGNNSRCLHFDLLLAFRMFIVNFMLGSIAGSTAGTDFRSIGLDCTVYRHIICGSNIAASRQFDLCRILFTDNCRTGSYVEQFPRIFQQGVGFFRLAPHDFIDGCPFQFIHVFARTGQKTGIGRSTVAAAQLIGCFNGILFDVVIGGQRHIGGLYCSIFFHIGTGIMAYHSYSRADAGIILTLDRYRGLEFIYSLSTGRKIPLDFLELGTVFQIYGTLVIRNRNAYAQLQNGILRIRQFIFHIQFQPQRCLGIYRYTTGRVRSCQFSLDIDFSLIRQNAYTHRGILCPLLPFDMVFHQIQDFTGKGFRIGGNSTSQTGIGRDIQRSGHIVIFILDIFSCSCNHCIFVNINGGFRIVYRHCRIYANQAYRISCHLRQIELLAGDQILDLREVITTGNSKFILCIRCDIYRITSNLAINIHRSRKAGNHLRSRILRRCGYLYRTIPGNLRIVFHIDLRINAVHTYIPLVSRIPYSGNGNLSAAVTRFLQRQVAAQAAVAIDINQRGKIQDIFVLNLCTALDIHLAGPHGNAINRIDSAADRNRPLGIKRQVSIRYHAQALRKSGVLNTVIPHNIRIESLVRRSHMHTAGINDTRSAHHDTFRR